MEKITIYKKINNSLLQRIPYPDLAGNPKFWKLLLKRIGIGNVAKITIEIS